MVAERAMAWGGAMNQFDIRHVAMGLAAYIIERQSSCERHQPENAPLWQEQRRLWTDAILQGMARLDGLEPDPSLMEQFDLELEQVRGCHFFTPATRQTQKGAIRELRRFVAAVRSMWSGSCWRICLSTPTGGMERTTGLTAPLTRRTGRWCA